MQPKHPPGPPMTLGNMARALAPRQRISQDAHGAVARCPRCKPVVARFAWQGRATREHFAVYGWVFAQQYIFPTACCGCFCAKTALAAIRLTKGFALRALRERACSGSRLCSPTITSRTETVLGASRPQLRGDLLQTRPNGRDRSR